MADGVGWKSTWKFQTIASADNFKPSVGMYDMASFDLAACRAPTARKRSWMPKYGSLTWDACSKRFASRAHLLPPSPLTLDSWISADGTLNRAGPQGHSIHPQRAQGTLRLNRPTGRLIGCWPCILSRRPLRRIMVRNCSPIVSHSHCPSSDSCVSVARHLGNLAAPATAPTYMQHQYYSSNASGYTYPPAHPSHYSQYAPQMMVLQSSQVPTSPGQANYWTNTRNEAVRYLGQQNAQCV